MDGRRRLSIKTIARGKRGSLVQVEGGGVVVAVGRGWRQSRRPWQGLEWSRGASRCRRKKSTEDAGVVQDDFDGNTERRARGGTEAAAGLVVRYARQRYRVKTVVGEVLGGRKL